MSVFGLINLRLVLALVSIYRQDEEAKSEVDYICLLSFLEFILFNEDIVCFWLKSFGMRSINVEEL